MADKPHQYPGGRPVRKPRWGVTSQFRIPDVMTPRLRQPGPVSAIGFHHVRPDPEPDDDGRE